MIEQVYSHGGYNGRVPEARYAYYRRCEVFRRNGEQCKAPAEKGAHICYAHAGQQRTALRRKIELAVLLAEVVRTMRARARAGFEIEHIFMDFKAIQVTLALMAQALVDGRIDSKTAGRLAVGLQTAAKLLWLSQKARITRIKRDTKAEEGRSGSRTMVTRGEEDHLMPISGMMRAGLTVESAHAPPEWRRAA
jgi:hypothetical protein